MSLSGRPRSGIVGTWLLLLLAVGGGFLSGEGRLERLNLRIYDLLLPVQSPPMSDQIVIVTIDDASIAELGRWPWSRQRHAELLDVLTSMGAAVVGLDILFSESQDAVVDQMLADAIARNGRTVLAVAPVKLNSDTPISELLPIAKLALSAAALGHVDVELDVDGLSRQYYRHGGLGDPHWPGLVLAMTDVAAGSAPAPRSIGRADEPGSGHGWVRSARGLIPYAAHDDPPLRLSYADVLAGRVARSGIEGKYVLVGVTASGVGDVISTPVSRSHERTPGVELIAHVLNGLLQKSDLHQLSPSLQTVLTLVLTLGGAIAVLWLPLRLGFLAMLGAMLVVMLSSAVLLAQQRLWFAPAAALLMLATAWLLWSVWRFGIEERLTRRLLGRLEHQTRHHLITGLPNQGMLEERLRRLGDRDPGADLTALLVLNISWHDSASVIMRRTAADALLLLIADRLRAVAPEGTFITHLNGDDFALLLGDQPDIQTVRRAAAGLLEQVKQPLSHEGSDVILVPHMGVSLWPNDGKHVSTLLRNAYTAMFQSRLDEHEGLCFYSADIGEKLQVRARLEQAMIHALQRDEFMLYYQPQLDAKSHRIIGAEALLRWHNPQLGWLSPAEFIPVAEHTGMIDVIGKWVLETACRDIKKLQQEGLGPLRVAVNLSPLQFSSSELVANIRAVVSQFGMTPADLELEVTESTVMNNLDSAVKAMHELRALGIGLAIDDFGTGYSSLSSLRSFPVDHLKIDQSFIREIGRSEDATGIVLTIIAMGRRLGLSVIAEGVETQEQADFLRQHGCDELQGYFFCRPVPVDEFAKHLRAELVIAGA